MDLRDIKEFFKDMLKYIIITVIVLILVIYVVSLQQVVGPSMNPTFENNDIVFINKLGYRFSNPKRNDIVSFNYSGTKYLIKRVIGLPGEHIEFKDNILYIDGKGYMENYLPDGTITEDWKLEDIGYDVIPEDMYLMLGDNRKDSMDGRDKKVGLIHKKDIIGKIFVRVWPLNEFKIIK